MESSTGGIRFVHRTKKLQVLWVKHEQLIIDRRILGRSAQT